jgi:hypothetical protein
MAGWFEFPHPHLDGDRSMHDPLDSPEIAVASKGRGGRSGQYGCILLLPTFLPHRRSSTPRAAYSRGVRVFAPVIPAPAAWQGAISRQAPPATTRAAPACLAGLRIAET